MRVKQHIAVARKPRVGPPRRVALPAIGPGSGGDLWTLGIYKESGFPEIWVLVPWEASVRAPGLGLPCPHI